MGDKPLIITRLHDSGPRDPTRTVLGLPVSTAEHSAAGQMLRVVRRREPGGPATLIRDSTQRRTSNQNNPST
jgi:hypothetical protein